MIHFQLQLTKSLQQAVLGCSLSARRQEKWDSWESLPPTSFLPNTLELACKHSALIPLLLLIMANDTDTHTQTVESRFLICALFPLSHHLCWGCCKSGLSSVSKVWASVVSLFSTPSGSSSPAGENGGWGRLGWWGTHLLYRILLSLLLAVTMAAAIKRISSHRHYLIPPPTHTSSGRSLIDFHCSHIFSAEKRN